MAIFRFAQGSAKSPMAVLRLSRTEVPDWAAIFRPVRRQWRLCVSAQSRPADLRRQWRFCVPVAVLRPLQRLCVPVAILRFYGGESTESRCPASG